MRRCPVSGEPMREEQIHGVTVDRSVHGVWLDKGELFRISESVREEVTFAERLFVVIKAMFWPETGRPEDHGDGSRPRPMPCPVCATTLQLDVYQDVYIDRCPKGHGVWLDQGELELILDRLTNDPDFLRGMRLRISDLQL